ncbi:FAD-binding oxidoreductase [Spirulina sp. CS-785/01]|uniref:NAD(P)/FAD-dependent oxidoreductase n=1 Tax=Spirulina sp. CS-785/01 TaxID=3021716 RepID=UPI00232ACD2E|nr:FAD-binding oxidoreductase [Spirulina sp. CS-785/01]MDB9313534.1 FAD-binding oxidoreductase [Spirulina sp. CS-785/01]
MNEESTSLAWSVNEKVSTYDWIVIGGGITGATLAYELVKQGLNVLLLEKNTSPDNATRYSYGGLAYWSGTSPLTRQLCEEGITIHRQLSAELDTDTEFRELDLILTVSPEDNPATLAQNYQSFAIPPTILTPEEACQKEPLLNPNALSGALLLPHGQMNPYKTNQGYLAAFQRLGGTVAFEPGVRLQQQAEKIVGVQTPTTHYSAAHTVVCAGGLTRQLLRENGMTAPVYFTHAEVIETVPTGLKLHSVIMPAALQRFSLEANSTQPDKQPLWEEANQEILPPILDPGAVQMQDGSFRLGQWSRVLSSPDAMIDPQTSETQIRQRVGAILPTVAQLPGRWRHCLVAFSPETWHSVGPVDNREGLYLFSGFSNPLVFTPALARHFATCATGQEDPILEQISDL